MGKSPQGASPLEAHGFQPRLSQGYPLTVQGLGLQKASVGPHGVTQE